MWPGIDFADHDTRTARHSGVFLSPLHLSASIMGFVAVVSRNLGTPKFQAIKTTWGDAASNSGRV